MVIWVRGMFKARRKAQEQILPPPAPPTPVERAQRAEERAEQAQMRAAARLAEAIQYTVAQTGSYFPGDQILWPPTPKGGAPATTWRRLPLSGHLVEERHEAGEDDEP